MNMIGKPRKPLLFFYGIVITALLIFNMFVMPYMAEMKINDVDYGTFISMTEAKNVGSVKIDDKQILFTDKEGKTIYRTGLIDDPGRTQRLYDSGAKFAKEIEKEMSPL